MDDRFDVQLLGGEERKTLCQIEAHLPPEQAQGASAGAVLLRGAGVANSGEKVEILAQRPYPFSASERYPARHDSPPDIGLGDPSITPNLSEGHHYAPILVDRFPLSFDHCSAGGRRSEAPRHRGCPRHG